VDGGGTARLLPGEGSGRVTHAALLAPVPEEYLIAGVEIVQRHGKLALGTRAWDVFHRLDELRQGEPVTAYLYASHAEANVGPTVTWTGLYVGYVESRGGAYPGDDGVRPPNTEEEDASRWWALFWHVTDLQQLTSDEWVRIGDLRKFSSQRRYGSGFIPEGPIIVGHP
jgi:hypothetical protein